MAKRKRGSRTRSRGRRMSGAGGGYKNVLMTVAGAVAGSIGGRMLGAAVSGNMKNPNLVNLVQIGAGAYVANSAKEPFIIGLGIGCAAVGATDMATRKGLIKGADDGEYVLMSGDDDDMAGDDDEIAGDDDVSSVAGDNFLQGDGEL